MNVSPSVNKKVFYSKRESMSNPVTPPDPYERHHIDAVERERQAREQMSGGEPPEEKWSLIAYFLKLVDKIIDLLLSERGRTRVAKRAKESLRALKAAFETLKKEDRSEDIQFLNHLSKVWQSVLEDTLNVQRDSTLSSEYKTLIKKIQHFPEHQPHTFGYYLSEYAGQKWIPFPYMELIQKIHTEHEKSPEASALAEWTSLIDQLLLKAE
jgi:hypothetical protein